MTKHKPRAGRAPSQRQRRVAELVRHTIITLLDRDAVHDPRVAGRSITVSEVRLSPDLRHATVFVLPLGGGETEEVMQGLRHAAPFIKRRVAEVIELRFAPDLHFAIDETFDVAEQVEAILHSPKVAPDLRSPDDGGDDEPGVPGPDGGSRTDSGAGGRGGA